MTSECSLFQPELLHTIFFSDVRLFSVYEHFFFDFFFVSEFSFALIPFFFATMKYTASILMVSDSFFFPFVWLISRRPCVCVHFESMVFVVVVGVFIGRTRHFFNSDSAHTIVCVTTTQLLLRLKTYIERCHLLTDDICKIQIIWHFQRFNSFFFVFFRFSFNRWHSHCRASAEASTNLFKSLNSSFGKQLHQKSLRQSLWWECETTFRSVWCLTVN